jgi:hypothetical protein
LCFQYNVYIQKSHILVDFFYFEFCLNVLCGPSVRDSFALSAQTGATQIKLFDIALLWGARGGAVG